MCNNFSKVEYGWGSGFVVQAANLAVKIAIENMIVIENTCRVHMNE